MKYLAGIEDIQAAKHRNADSNCCEGRVDRCSTVDMTACITTGTAWEMDSSNADLLGRLRAISISMRCAYFWFGNSSVVSASSATMARKSKIFPVETFLPEKWFMQKTIQFGHTGGRLTNDFKAIAVIWRGKNLSEKDGPGRLLQRRVSAVLICSVLRTSNGW